MTVKGSVARANTKRKVTMPDGAGTRKKAKVQSIWNDQPKVKDERRRVSAYSSPLYSEVSFAE